MLVELDGHRPQLGPQVFVAPDATLIGQCKLDQDVSIWFRTVLRGDLEPIIIGERSNIQDGSVLHTDPGYPCVIGREVTVGHGCIVHGAVVEDRALIGMGAIVLTGAKIGQGALVAAGALVPEGREIPPGWLAMGSPAKPVRQLTGEEIARMDRGVQHYLDQKSKYLAKGK